MVSRTKVRNEIIALVIIVLVTAFFLLPVFQSSVAAPSGPYGLRVTVRTSLSCYFIGFGEVYVSWFGWVGYEWSYY